MIRALSFLVLIVYCNSTFAQPMPIPGTQRLAPVFKRADIVCDRKTESIEMTTEQKLLSNGQSYTVRHNRAKVRILDLYKLSHAVGPYINVDFDETLPSGWTTPSIGIAGDAILFLNQSANFDYVFADKFMGAIHFTSIPVQTGSPGLGKLESALVAIIQLPDRNDRITALQALEGMDSLAPGSISAIASLSKSTDPDVALTALAALIKASASDGVELLSSYLRTYVGDANHLAFISIGSELRGVHDPRAESALESLTTSTILSIKHGAVAALGNIRDPHSALALVQQLDDPNLDVRFNAVIALAKLSGKAGDFRPNRKDFNSNPDDFTNRWKRWWSQNGAIAP